ncbi:hypothetical protein SBF1_8030003 [Candidatus Desulfosporosinus infrequens]|uniref:Uncharacterized protein n=1 Tax=Candidatus Desulfosporosinus infrequens TaxID=2043169 RepID=A0A2U3LTN1_9FIRM|nr:hypothetical protein SBF1_8030003 [Candidatus Desulfosporosinus infrequens]
MRHRATTAQQLWRSNTGTPFGVPARLSNAASYKPVTRWE